MTESTPAPQGFVLGSKLYDRVKFVVTILLPGLATFYATVAGIWGLPNAQGVVGTITALALFLGLIIGISSKNFNPPPPTGAPVGKFVVTTLEDGKKSVKLDLDQDPASFIDQDVISFHLNKQDDQVPVAEADRDENSP